MATKKAVVAKKNEENGITTFSGIPPENREEFVRRVSEYAFLRALDGANYKYAGNVAEIVVKGAQKLADELGITE